MTDALSALPARRGHFLLESGYHTDRWLDLDALFVDTAAIAPIVAELAGRLRAHRVTAVCGPLLGGAFLAQSLAAILKVRFYYTMPDATGDRTGLFAASYRFPDELERRVRGERLAVMDDVISAGSSVRATLSAIERAGATAVVVGAVTTLGNAGVDHFARIGIPVEALQRQEFSLWSPDSCPLCRDGAPLVDPRARVT